MRITYVLALGLVVACVVYGLRLTTITTSTSLPGVDDLRDAEGYYAAANSDSTRMALASFGIKHKALLEDVWEESGSRDQVTIEEIPAVDSLGEEEGKGWKDRFPRTNSDLVRVFLGGSDLVSARRLVRHVVLNKGDVPLADSEISFLQDLVRVRAARLRELFLNYRLARDQEMRILAESGQVEPIEVPELDDNAIERVALQISQSVEQESYLGGMSLDDLRTYVKSNPPTGAALPGVSFFSTIGGGTYLFRQFPDLPYSDTMFGDLKFFAGQFLAEVSALFLSKGYASEYEVSEMLDRVANFHPKRLRQIR